MNLFYMYNDAVIYVSKDYLETGSIKKVKLVGTW